MNKHNLRKQQKALMRERAVYERLQTEYSGDAEFYRYIQARMDKLDDETETIRAVLEGVMFE